MKTEIERLKQWIINQESVEINRFDLEKEINKIWKTYKRKKIGLKC